MKHKKLLSTVFTVALCLIFPSQALAADWTVADWGTMQTAFADSDAEVNISVTNDVTCEDTLTTGAGQTYNVNGGGNVLTDLSLTGAGTVAIVNTVLEGENDYALETSGEVSVEVTGDVDGTLSASEDSQVTVNGNVTGESGDPLAVNYDNPSEYSDGDDAIYAEDNSVVTVNGNVTGGDAYGTDGYAGDGIYQSDFATVVVNGDVTGGSVTANPLTAAGGYHSLGGDGIIMADGTGSIMVHGDVTGGSTNGDNGTGGYGIIASYVTSDSAPGNVCVHGTVTGGAATGTNSENGTPLYYEVADNEEDFVPAASPVYPTITVQFLKKADAADSYYTSEDGNQTATLLGQDVIYILEAPANAQGLMVFSNDRPIAGEQVTITADSRILSIYVNGVKLTGVNGVFTFVMPEGGAAITADLVPAVTTSTVSLPKTGDTSGVFLLVLVGAGIASISAGLFLARRRGNTE